jgi:hypothetical protein
VQGLIPNAHVRGRFRGFFCWCSRVGAPVPRKLPGRVNALCPENNLLRWPVKSAPNLVTCPSPHGAAAGLQGTRCPHASSPPTSTPSIALPAASLQHALALSAASFVARVHAFICWIAVLQPASRASPGGKPPTHFPLSILDSNLFAGCQPGAVPSSKELASLQIKPKIKPRADGCSLRSGARVCHAQHGRARFGSRQIVGEVSVV